MKKLSFILMFAIGSVFAQACGGSYCTNGFHADWSLGMVSSYKFQGGSVLAQGSNQTQMPNNGTSGVESYSNLPQIKPYPNPAIDFINVPVTEATYIEVYNIGGQQVMNVQVQPGSQLNISELAPGAYVLRSKAFAPCKIIKQF